MLTMTALLLSKIQQKNRNILQNKLQYEITLIYLNIFLNGIYSYDGKAEFSPIITPDITYMILYE